MKYVFSIKTINEEDESPIEATTKTLKGLALNNSPFFIDFSGSCRESLTYRYRDASLSPRLLNMKLTSDTPIRNILTKNRIINKILLEQSTFDINFDEISFTEKRLIPSIISLVWYIFCDDTWTIKNTANYTDICKHIAENDFNPFEMGEISRFKIACFYWLIATRKINPFEKNSEKLKEQSCNGPVSFIDNNFDSIKNEFGHSTGISNPEESRYL